MKCSAYVKSRGLKSLQFLSDKTGVPVTTLRDWYRDRELAFKYLVKGVVCEQREENTLLEGS